MELSIVVEGTMFGSPGSMPGKSQSQSFNGRLLSACQSKDIKRPSNILLIVSS